MAGATVATGSPEPDGDGGRQPAAITVQITTAQHGNERAAGPLTGPGCRTTSFRKNLEASQLNGFSRQVAGDAGLREGALQLVLTQQRPG